MRWAWPKLVLLCGAVIVYVYITTKKGHSVNPSNYTEVAFGHNLKTLIHFREKIPRFWNVTVVLLHDGSSDSSVWVKTSTLDTLWLSGYRVIAIDLPGYGYSKSLTGKPSIPKRGAILREILVALNADASVLVSPSVSGIYSLPVVVRGDLPLKGFVSIAIKGADHFSNTEYGMLSIPTYIFYCEKDELEGKISRNKLRLIKNSKEHAFPGAGHACYLDHSDEFNQVLLSFLKNIGT